MNDLLLRDVVDDDLTTLFEVVALSPVVASALSATAG
jgi:hypothetical protein